MWEAFLSITLFGSFVWWLVISTVVLIILFWSDIAKNGYWAFGFAVGYLLLFYFKGNQELLFLLDWKLLATYFSIGVVYSALRTIALGNKHKIVIQKYLSDSPTLIKTKLAATKYKHSQGKELISNLSNNVSRWILMWPISLTVWVFSDLFTDFWRWLWTKISSVFEGIFRLGFGADDDINFTE
jgi:hypothetical protein